MDKCTIFTGGVIEDMSFIDVNSVKNSLVICADSGYLHAKKLGIRPAVVIGDYDSLGFIPDEKSVLTYPVEKDDTDIMLAIKEALKCGYKAIDIYGALGGRFDHTMGNVQALAYVAEQKGHGRILSGTEQIEMFNPGEHKLLKKPGWSLSLFAYSDKVKNLSISGVKYPINTIFINTFPLGVSNIITNNEATISFSEGMLLVVQSKINQ